FSRRRRHTRFSRDWSSDVCSSDLHGRIWKLSGRICHHGNAHGFTEGGWRNAGMLFKITAEIVFVSEIQDRSDFFHTHDRKMDEFFSLQNNPLVDQYRRRLMKEN